MFYTMKKVSISGEPVYALYIVGFDISSGGRVQHFYINYYDEPCGECVTEEEIDLDWENMKGEAIEQEIRDRLNRFVDEMAHNCFEDGFDRTCYLYDWGILGPADEQSTGPFMILFLTPSEEDGYELDDLEELFEDRKAALQRIETLRKDHSDKTQFIIVEYQEKN